MGLTPEDIIEKYKAAAKVKENHEAMVRVAKSEMTEWCRAYWALKGKMQVGDTVAGRGKKGVVSRIEFRDWDAPPNMSPNIFISPFKKDGTRSNREVHAYGFENWQVVSKAV